MSSGADEIIRFGAHVVQLVILMVKLERGSCVDGDYVTIPTSQHRNSFGKGVDLILNWLVCEVPLARTRLHVVMGVGRIFSRGGAKSGEIWFLPLEIEKMTFFANNFKIHGEPCPPLPTPMHVVVVNVLNFVQIRSIVFSTRAVDLLFCKGSIWGRS